MLRAEVREASEPDIRDDELAVLESIQRRVLWLATAIIHHANHVRPNPDGIKVGGHQASSASVVSILTALYFQLPAGRRPRGGQAARLAGLPRRPVPARQPAARVPDHAARVRRPAGLPEPHQGPGPGRLLDRLGRPRRGRAGLRRAGRTATPSIHFGSVTLAALRRAGRRRRAGRGQRLGGGRRGARRRARQRALDRRPQPPEPRPGHPRHPGRASSRRCSATAAGRCSRPSTAAGCRPSSPGPAARRCAGGSTT